VIESCDNYKLIICKGRAANVSRMGPHERGDNLPDCADKLALPTQPHS
jgi:hypothetical protein